MAGLDIKNIKMAVRLLKKGKVRVEKWTIRKPEWILKQATAV